MDGEATLRLDWATKKIGCLLPAFVAGTGLFGLAALSADYAAELADGRRGALIRMTRAVSLGGVNVPLALVALYFAFETLRFAWRWADEEAVRTSAAGLHFHGSLFKRPVRWEELRAVRVARLMRGSTVVQVLEVETAAGGRIEVGGIDSEEAERFCVAVMARLAGRKG